MYSATDHRHYIYTPKQLTLILHYLYRYESMGHEALFYESTRFQEKIVDAEGKNKYDQIVSQLMSKYFGAVPLQTCYRVIDNMMIAVPK